MPKDTCLPVFLKSIAWSEDVMQFVKLWFPKHACPWKSFSKWWLKKQTHSSIVKKKYWKSSFCPCYCNTKLTSWRTMNIAWLWWPYEHYMLSKTHFFSRNVCPPVYNFSWVYHFQTHFWAFMKFCHSLSL